MDTTSPKKVPAEPKMPTRRSKRGQPVVATNAASTSTKLAWSTRNPARTRPIDPATDLYNDDADSWNNLDQTERAKLRTYIYDAFERTKTTTVKKAPGQKRAVETKIESQTTDTYCIGDTVLIQGTTARPSVAVIVGLWETDLTGEDDEPLSKRMRIRIQWFLRPKQLPKFGVKREHRENEIYYSTTRNMILDSPDAILGHCQVRDVHNEKVDDDPFIGFQCRSAVDSQRGLFYNFAWEAHRKDALAKMQTDSNSALDISGAPWAIVVKSRSKARVNQGHADRPCGGELEKLAESHRAREEENSANNEAGGRVEDDDMIEQNHEEEPDTTSQKRKAAECSSTASPEKRMKTSDGAVEPTRLEKRTATQHDSTPACLRDLNVQERLMLASLVKCMKREGVEESEWAEALHQHLIYTRGADDLRRKPNKLELAEVLEHLLTSRVTLLEDG